MIASTRLHPDLAVEDAASIAAFLESAGLSLDILLAEDGFVCADSTVANVLERLNVLEDNLLTGLGTAVGITVE